MEDRWTSRWTPSGDTPPQGRGADRSQSYGRGDTNRYNSASRTPTFSGSEDRWTRLGQGQHRDDRTGGGRMPGERGTSGHGHQRYEPRHQQDRYQPQHRRQRDSTGASGAQWIARGKPDGDLMGDAFNSLDLMGEAFGALDPGEAEPGAPGPSNGAVREDDPWLDSNEDSSSCDFAPSSSTGLTLAQLEAAVSGGDIRDWSLERLAEAATAMCHLRSASGQGQEPGSAISPFSRREQAVMDDLATAAICRSRRGALPRTATSQDGWAVAQLLWACARGQYWAGPPRPRPGTWAVSGANDGITAGAAVSGDSSRGPVNGDRVKGPHGPSEAWPSPAELRSKGGGAAAPDAPGDAAREPVGAEGPGAGGDAVDSNGCRTGDGEGKAGDQNSGDGDAAGRSTPHGTGTTDASKTLASSDGNGAARSDGAVATEAWRPLAVELLVWLTADSCRLVTQLDSKSLSLVWWSLAKAAAVSRAKHGAAHMGPVTPAAAAAAADLLTSASPALIAALDLRAVEELSQKNNAKLCALLYSCACVNRSSERLLTALGNELAARLERVLILGDAGIAGMPRGRFSSRELSCIAYSCGLLGLRHERLMGVLAEYAASCAHSKWSASAISVFMYGIANVGHRDQRLMTWAEDAITGKPAIDFNLRNISFLLYNFHRLRWWPRRAAEHLLSAARLHPPPSIPLISISTILMCMGSGRARDERSLAHLCQALTRRPAAQLSCKDVCICLTALQRLHGEDVLASQQPEVLAALDHLVEAIVARGFSRRTPACRAVAVFNHQEVSNAMFALGKLKYYSPAVLDTLRDHAARGGLAGASAWDCTAILVGLAQLNYGGDDGTGEPGSGGAGRRGGSGTAGDGAEEVDLVGMLAETVAQRARTAKSQDLANTLWALTVLEGALERYRPRVMTLLEEVNRRGPASRNPDGFNVDEQRQLWQVHRELAALQQPYASLREDLVRLGKLGMSEADHTYSRVQASFQSLLSAMHSSGRFARLRDLLFEQELVPGGEQLMRIDVQAIIERPSPDGGNAETRVAIEFDGPFHFMVNEPYTARIDGRTALRNRILTRHLGQGNLVCVSMAEWVAASREPTSGMPGRWRLMANKMGI